MPTPSRRGRFYVLDGIDGCGKSTQAARLARALEARGGRAPLHLREPGSTAAGERLRALLLEPGVGLSPAAQVLLFAAARRQMLEERVAPALGMGHDVVCERFHPATVAYQGAALEVGEERVLELLLAWAGEPAPDLVIVLDLAPEDALSRRGQDDRFEGRGLAFHRRVAESYRRYAARDKAAVLVSAAGSPEEVEARIRSAIEARSREGEHAGR
jgi:dTMP kinase